MPKLRLFAVILSAAASPALAADATHPVVVELFQSQGCSSCPPADANLNAIAGRADVLALNFAVTYWDRLGWKDTFAQPAFTRRQYDYAKAAGRAQVATPQMIVDGTQVINGSDAAQLARVIGNARRRADGPSIVVTPGGVAVVNAPARASRATVWLVRYDPRTIAVPIRAGENGGRTLPHRNVVRALTKLGTLAGPTASFAVPNAPYRAAILVQQGTGGPILAAARL